MISDVSIIIAFFAGILSFVSPCVLPIVPGFMAYIFGKSIDENQNSKIHLKKRFFDIGLFIIGFSIIFILLGLAIDIFMSVFFSYRQVILFFSGLIIIIFALLYIGIINILFLQKKFEFQVMSRHFLSPLFIGMAFAFGWSPCIGPILGSILGVAALNSGNGFILLSFYSLGLGIPFLIIGLGLSKLSNLISGTLKYMKYIKLVTGIILLLTGLLIMTGSIQDYGFFLIDYIPNLDHLLM